MKAHSWKFRGLGTQWDELAAAARLIALSTRAEPEVVILGPGRPTIGAEKIMLSVARPIVRVRRRYLRDQAGWDFAVRAFIACFADPNIRGALDSAERLGGDHAVSALVTRLGTKPREQLTPEQRAARRKEGVAARSQRLARVAARELASAQKKLKAAQVAVHRAEVLVRKWGGRVTYHQERGRLLAQEES